MPARANSTSAGPNPRCRNAAPPPALRRSDPEVSAGGGGSSANTCVKRLSRARSGSSAAYSHSTGPAAARARSKASAAAPRRQAHPRLAPEALRPQVALHQRRPARHVRTQDEQRLAGRHEVAEHAQRRPRRGDRQPYARSPFRAHRGPRLRRTRRRPRPRPTTRHRRSAHGSRGAPHHAASECSERTTSRGSTAPAPLVGLQSRGRGHGGPAASRSTGGRRGADAEADRTRASSTRRDGEAHVAALAHRAHVGHPCGRDEHVHAGVAHAERAQAPQLLGQLEAQRVAGDDRVDTLHLHEVLGR